MYTRGTGASHLLVGVYVNDLIITGTHPLEIAKFKVEMKGLFKMSDLGLLGYYLGIKVHQDQAAYALKILEKCGLVDYNPCQVPMEARLKLSKKSTSPPTDATWFQSVVSSL